MNSNSWFPTVFDDFFNSDWMPKMKFSSIKEKAAPIAGAAFF